MSDETVKRGAEEDRLLARLRELTEEIDPVPEEVTSFATAALGWRRIDAELAELLSDSALESESLATRSAGAARSLTFQAIDLVIALEIQELDAGALLLGQLAPPAVAAIDVRADDGSLVATAVADELGRFRVELAERRRVRIHVRLETSAAPVETSWFDI
jgi:hypothetical protein